MAITKTPQVKEAFKNYPPAYRKKLNELRKLILSTAKENNEQVGKIEETLKWGQPSYQPIKSKTGTPIRIHWLKSKPDQYGIYFHCQTKMILKIKKKFRSKFKYEGKRALIFKKDDDLPVKDLQECIMMAFTYHLNETD